MTRRHWQLAVLSRSSRRAVAVISSGRVVAATLHTRRWCAVVNSLLWNVQRRERGREIRVNLFVFGFSALDPPFLITQVFVIAISRPIVLWIYRNLKQKNALPTDLGGNQSSGWLVGRSGGEKPDPRS